ncbi:coproporphyrinogen III oxidase [Salinivibrio sp. MA351]|uniref:Coproporphyrinogen III oxidase n=1 Tax=Salinivibrio costicola subsp. alcaliphilus TaxID=272773 RepID=A0ABX3KP79_SALCS|nr:MULTISPECIES: DUF2489 domain-containing protein [Salinivibrio]NUY57059.1 DUF2489 domain-containing protein [Salinivibrio sp. EAGSL]OOE89132.1 coproporphyrinogen III oxidase [Salinivibrio sp. AR640]OOE90476.1 coproporphyrinogen III oxidase [Salinivibrio sp. AR647]OOE96835.1 coproporphyrinogen III oxidase [Salinivibrio sp. IB643]OOE97065.1 coproporphyrinogen III oxidase [Salinivibrio sp. MA351]
MQDGIWILAGLGALIILALSVYAGTLLARLKRQTALQAEMEEAAIKKRNDKIIESVDVIAFAALKDQCDLSEAAIRLYMIMDHLQGEKRVEFDSRYPALFELYEAVKDTPRGDARKTLKKNERMRLDFDRAKHEARLEQAIKAELAEILAFTGGRHIPDHILTH